MLDPSRSRKNLFKLLLCQRTNISVMVEENSTGTGGTLIECQYVSHKEKVGVPVGISSAESICEMFDVGCFISFLYNRDHIKARRRTFHFSLIHPCFGSFINVFLL